MAPDWLWGDRIHKTVILDSSAIMMLFDFSIDLEKELTRLLGAYHIVVPTPVVRELEFLSEKGKGEKKTKAKASLKLIEKFETIDTNKKKADGSILELAEKINGVVVTNDKELKTRLKEIPRSVIFLRAKKKLVME
ncbi:MAG: PIN domain-containing protein [Petrotogales bacterium]